MMGWIVERKHFWKYDWWRQRCVMLMRHRKLRKSVNPVRQFVIRVQNQPSGPKTTCMNPVCGSFFLRLISGNRETLESVFLHC